MGMVCVQSLMQPNSTSNNDHHGFVMERSGRAHHLSDKAWALKKEIENVEIRQSPYQIVNEIGMAATTHFQTILRWKLSPTTERCISPKWNWKMRQNEKARNGQIQSERECKNESDWMSLIFVVLIEYLPSFSLSFCICWHLTFDVFHFVCDFLSPPFSLPLPHSLCVSVRLPCFVCALKNCWQNKAGFV